MWHKETFSYDSHVMRKGFIAVFGQHFKSNCRCVVVNVYVVCSLRETKTLWGNLFNLKRHPKYRFGAFAVILMP